MRFFKSIFQIFWAKTMVEKNVNAKLADAMEALWSEGIYHELGAAHEILRRNKSEWAIGVAEDYCGHGIAVAGRGLLYDVICARTLISNERLAGIGPEGSAFRAEPETPSPADIRRGDIVTVNATQGRPFGTHIVLSRGGVDEAGTFKTVEANSLGRRADGTDGKGVVKKQRRTDEVARIYRLTGAHYK